MTFRDQIDLRPVGRLQYLVLSLCVLCSVAEGFDIISMSIAVVPLTAEWQLSGTLTGLLLSMGPAGMILGAVGLAPLADRYGRRKLLLLSVTLVAAGMLASALAPNVEALLATRFLAGIGMGAVIPILALVVGEFFPVHRRATAIGISTIGNPAGAAVGGAVGAGLIAAFGWHAIFAAGGVATVGIVIALAILLPESPDFLDAHAGDRKYAAAKAKLQKFLTNIPEADVSIPARNRKELRGAMSSGFRLQSKAMVLLALVFITANGAYYLANLWLPRLLILSGLGEADGIRSVTFFSLGGACGGLLFALITIRCSAFTGCLALLSGGVASFLVMAVTASHLIGAYATAFVLGMCMLGVLGGLYALAPLLFRTEARASALGIAGGFGRVGTTLGPLGIGMLVDRGWSPASLFNLAVVPTLVAVIGIVVLSAWRRRALVMQIPEDAMPSSVGQTSKVG